MKTKRQLQRDIERGKYILNPDFNESEAEKEDRKNHVMNACMMRSVRFGRAFDQFTDYYPEDFDKAVPESGAWVIVKHPPHTEYTVPPFSIWFALPWYMEKGSICGETPKRVRIQTPSGDLGLFPHEYVLAQDIKSYFGREREGVLMHRLGNDSGLPEEQLFYLQARGIRREDAVAMLFDLIREPNYAWFEIAPPYGKYFGQEWPSTTQCPFATPLEQWKEEKGKEEHVRQKRDRKRMRKSI